MLVGLGISFAVLIGELALRVAGWPAVGFYRDGVGPLPPSIPSRLGGAYRAFPGPARVKNYEYDVEVHVNAQGFFERELEPKRAGEHRIGLLGDSMTMGLGVTASERFASIWSARIADRAPTLTVYDLGTPWAGTAHEADILGGVGRSYDFDEIVVAFYGGNDPTENRFWFENEARILADPTYSYKPTFRTWLRMHTRLPSFLWVQGLRSLSYLAPDGYYSQSSLDAVWPATERALAKLLEEVGRRPLTIWYLPTVVEWDDAVWNDVRLRTSAAPEGRRAVFRALEEWADKQGIPLVDVIPAFGGHTARELIFPIDGHWNRDGHRIVGEYLAGLGTTSHALHWTGEARSDSR